MNSKLKNLLTLGLLGLFILAFLVTTVVSPAEEYSYAERRKLKEFPKVKFENMMSGSYMSDFETASLDQFPLRDFFRSVKAYTMKDFLMQPANHDIYMKDGYLAKLEYPVSDRNVEHSVSVLNKVYSTFLKDTDCKTYLSVISDKNRYLAAGTLYPTMDYEKFIGHIRDNASFAQYIDITDQLSLDKFYLTDQHWKQESIVPVADALLAGLNRKNGFIYKENTLESDFYGTYASQSALNVKPETIHYLTNDVLDSCKVTSYGTGSPKDAVLYDMKKGAGRDAYEMFLQGSEPLLVIENDNAEADGELIVFRDSFGSSLVPLLIPAYKKITLVDLRYMNMAALPNFVEFHDQDVLFLYSTLILNNSISQ